ncbi:MAG: hypothetical protein RI924_1444 [Bacteroidota bacterium]|jgi:phosphoglycerol transferase MdoB-like AlkP superfamily enzyme
MLKHAVIFLRFFVFSLSLFFLDRLVFLIYFNEKLRFEHWSAYFSPFFYGLRLDLSMAAYLTLPPLLYYLAGWFFPRIRFSPAVAKTYTQIILFLSAFITVVNLNIYREWGTKFNYRAIDFAINSPNEALASSASSPLILSLIIFSFLIIAYLYLSRTLIVFQRPAGEHKQLHKVLSTCFSLVLTFLLIRGGWQLAPINQSMSYYSQKPIENHAAVNTIWNLLHDISKNRSNQQNPYPYLDVKEARRMVDELYPDVPKSDQQVLSTSRPNVVLIILESFHADLVESLGGEKGLAPELEKVIKNGILFDQVYATGDRTDKGTIAILSAFPSQAIRSIIKENGKQEKLPSISEVFKKNKYHTSYYYGGESEFFGMKSYVLSHGYEKLVDKNEFERKDMNSKWGAYDEKVFERQLQDLNKSEQPFFSTLLTLTNHEPFEVPGKPKFPLDEGPNLIRNTAFYTDSCIGAYLNAAQKTSWYKNTLFVLIADHGHRLPLNKYENWEARRYQVPLIFFGEVIKPVYRGTRINKIGGQTDLAKTLLNQLGMESTAFNWSKDLFQDKSLDFAFYSWDNGFGWINKEQAVSFDNVGKTILYQQKTTLNKQVNHLKQGKAYLQTVFQEYLDY